MAGRMRKTFVGGSNVHRRNENMDESCADESCMGGAANCMARDRLSDRRPHRRLHWRPRENVLDLLAVEDAAEDLCVELAQLAVRILYPVLLRSPNPDAAPPEANR